jgi:hypothetical protein
MNSRQQVNLKQKVTGLSLFLGIWLLLSPIVGLAFFFLFGYRRSLDYLPSHAGIRALYLVLLAVICVIYVYIAYALYGVQEGIEG